ncbi:hypothetical protein LB505_002591 [Fusarium chuoi]|nr:hypothetical protein LB505_002591 [Fusarium chuoi]
MIESVCVKQQALDDYNVYLQELLKRMVWTGSCRSWYKNRKKEGHVTAVYGGSRHHFRGKVFSLFLSRFRSTFTNIRSRPFRNPRNF